MIDMEALFGAPDETEGEKVSFRVFPRRGPARWLLERRYKRPWHLKTWPRANFRARLIFRTAWAISYLGLHLPSRRIDITVAPNSPYAELRRNYNHLGIFLGTPGPNRKIIVFAGQDERALYMKIPLGPSSQELTLCEEKTLAALASDPDLAPIVPAARRVAGHLAVESLERGGARYGVLSCTELARIHDLLFARSQISLSLGDVRCAWEERVARLCDILPPVSHPTEIRTKIDSTRMAAVRFLNELDQHALIDCYIAHGDLTRWNVLVGRDGRARVLDWEMSGLQPRYFDFIHYLASTGLNVARGGAEAILAEIRNCCVEGKLAIGHDEDAWRVHTGLYFAYQVTYYAALYSRQVDLHPQAIWQLDIWQDVLERLAVKCAANQSNTSPQPASGTA